MRADFPSIKSIKSVSIWLLGDENSRFLALRKVDVKKEDISFFLDKSLAKLSKKTVRSSSWLAKTFGAQYSIKIP